MTEAAGRRLTIGQLEIIFENDLIGFIVDGALAQVLADTAGTPFTALHNRLREELDRRLDARQGLHQLLQDELDRRLSARRIASPQGGDGIVMADELSARLREIVLRHTVVGGYPDTMAIARKCYELDRI